VFAKDFMRKHDIPTAEYHHFTRYSHSLKCLQTILQQGAIKVSGLAAGKGVIIAKDKSEAEEALKDIMVSGAFASARSSVSLRNI
jgi:phosphoribosylamine-glycine ligase